MIAQTFIDHTGSVNQVLEQVSLSKSTYYYSSKKGRRGRRPSAFTVKADGSRVPDEQVVSSIKTLLLGDFVDYGYHKVTHYLKQQGYVINKKKVYRLMKEAGLLHGKRIKTTGSRTFVKYRKVNPNKPYELLEMDIKYLYLPDENRNAYLLTVLDVFSRKALGYVVKRSIRKDDVIYLLESILETFSYQPGEIMIRSDNGSQFLANKVRDYLKDSAVGQEFTHIATPEENAHIEAFHSILERELVQRGDFDTFLELEGMLVKYFRFYNDERIHSSLGFISPERYLRKYEEKNEILEKKVSNQVALSP
jgi:putative transposase